MKLSTERILTTHVGSLARPRSLLDLILAKEEGRPVDAAAFETQSDDAVADVVAKQVAAGIDVVSDGEMSKPSYATNALTHSVDSQEQWNVRCWAYGSDSMCDRQRCRSGTAASDYW